MDSVTTIGLDIAKSVFQVHGVGCCGRGGHPKEADPWAGPRVLREVAPMSRRDRGMQLLALLGERTDRTRS